MKKFLLVLLVFSIMVLPVSARVIQRNVKVIKVIDGDTIIVNWSKLPVRVRFAKIDAYETHLNSRVIAQMTQTGLSMQEILSKGEQAKTYVTKRIQGRTICLQLDTKHLTGGYGRYLGIIYSSSCFRTRLFHKASLNDELLKKHLAIPYKPSK